MIKLEYDKEYYEALHKWICEAEYGVYDFKQLAKPETMEKFMNHIYYWINISEFWDEGFYIEISNDYKYLVKARNYIDLRSSEVSTTLNF